VLDGGGGAEGGVGGLGHAAFADGAALAVGEACGEAHAFEPAAGDDEDAGGRPRVPAGLTGTRLALATGHGVSLSGRGGEGLGARRDGEGRGGAAAWGAVEGDVAAVGFEESAGAG